MSVLMAATAATLFALGTYLLMQRKLSRIIVGLGLLSHGANVLFVNSGRRGIPPLIGSGDPDDFADPVPQALVLTAIVISFGTTALLLALAYRSWLLTSDDEVADDVEDRMVGASDYRDVEVADETLLIDEAEASDAHAAAGDVAVEDDGGCSGSMRVLLPLPVLLPLIGAASSILVGRSRVVQRAISLSVLTAVVGIAVAMLVDRRRDGVVPPRPATGTHRSASRSWPTGSRRSCCSPRRVVLLAVVVYAIGQPGAERNHVGFQSVYLMLAAGVAAAFLTGDLFNLFVAIEMMLTASYVLDHARRTARPGALRHDLRRDQPARFGAVPGGPGVHLRGHRHGQHGRPRRPHRRAAPAACRPDWPDCSSSCSASRRASSRSSSGCPTATRPRRRRSRRSSPACSPRSACTPSSAPRPCCSPTCCRPGC